MEAIRAGLGFGVLQQGIARRNPDLVTVLVEEICFPLEVWLVVHEDQRHLQNAYAAERPGDTNLRNRSLVSAAASMLGMGRLGWVQYS